MADLISRLEALGHAVDGDAYTDATAQAVAAFQQDRGLDVTGICDGRTWATLIEANYALGDRNLYLHTPMWRGDDVAELQLALGELGFDAGRVDGIFGPDTLDGLVDFQRNVGLVPDGIAGRRTVRELGRYRGRTTNAQPVTTVKERNQLRKASAGAGLLRAVVGEQGGAAALVATVARELRRAGVTVLTLDHPSPSARAQTANAFEADIYLGLSVAPQPSWTSWYFSVPGYESIGGRELANRLVCFGSGLAETHGAEAVGKRLPILRETKMPAVVCEIGPPDLLIRNSAAIAAGIVASVQEWTTSRLPAGN